MSDSSQGRAEPQDRLWPAWLALTESFGADQELTRRTFDDLVSCYASAGRYYHNAHHVGEVLETVETLRLLAHDFAAVQLAAWFHDVVYDPRAGDNEERSAERAEKVLPALRVPAEPVATVKRLILLTKTHHATPADVDGQILLDADLAVLGAEPARYAAYAAAIRQEYSWVPPEQFAAGRRRVLQAFLERDRIYLTAPLFARLEAAARRNLAAESAALK